MALEIERDACLGSGIINQYCSSSFETVSEPVIGRAFARPVGGLLQRRAQLRSRGDEV
jgi:hypothetical protein